MGSGLMLQHRIPTYLSEVDAALLSTRLNLLESRDSTRCHALDSWAVDPKDSLVSSWVLITGEFVPKYWQVVTS